MKNKLKLWILQIEGWKKSKFMFIQPDKSEHMALEKTIGIFDHKATIEHAWEYQFLRLKDIVSTNIFWLIFPMVLGALFLLFSDNSTIVSNGIHWFNYAGLICFIWPVLYTLAGIGNWVYKGIKKWKGGNK